MKHVQTVIIGAGQAAPALASAMAKQGDSVAIIEAHHLGGTCVNAGCTPTKTLRKSARVAHVVRNADTFGVSTADVHVDFSAAMTRMRDVVMRSRTGLEQWLSGQSNIEVIHGEARFEGRDGEKFRIGIGDDTLTADHVYINTGTRPFVPAISGLTGLPFLDNVSLLDLKACPQHLVIIGGSYIGLEMGQIFRRLGAEVTIVEPGPRIAAREDTDVSAAIEAVFREEGITVLTGSGIDRVESRDDDVALLLKNGKTVLGSHLLVATGRTPNSDKLNLDAIGVNADERGYIPTDEKLQTNIPGVWALGDINKRGAFTHTSYHDHEIVLAQATNFTQPLYQWKDADQRPSTYAMFTDPPLGRVGMSLNDARNAAAQGQNILVATRQMKDISRAKEEGETAGLIRLIVDGNTEKILGASVLGITGDEVIAVISNFMATGSSFRMMQQALPVHPTVAELLPTILANLAPIEP